MTFFFVFKWHCLSEDTHVSWWSLNRCFFFCKLIKKTVTFLIFEVYWGQPRQNNLRQWIYTIQRRPFDCGVALDTVDNPAWLWTALVCIGLADNWHDVLTQHLKLCVLKFWQSHQLALGGRQQLQTWQWGLFFWGFFFLLKLRDLSPRDTKKKGIKLISRKWLPHCAPL